MANFIVNDVVHNIGNAYICIQGHNSTAAGSEPGAGTASTTYWNLMAAKGSAGTSGTSGGSGTSGSSGTSGLAGTSGSSGTSGLAGTSGSSGTGGSSGTSGTSGTSGVGFYWKGVWA